MVGEHATNRPVSLTCPECGGALRQKQVGAMPYFECHIGHRLALANLETAHFARLEEAMEYALRFLNERAELCRIIAQALHARDEEAAEKWEAARRESETRFDELRAIVERDWLRPRQFGPGAGQPAGAEQDSDGG